MLLLGGGFEEERRKRKNVSRIREDDLEEAKAVEGS